MHRWLWALGACAALTWVRSGGFSIPRASRAAAPQAVALNRWLWFLQIPVISSPWLSYLFVSGAELIVRVRPQQWAFDLTWLFGSRFDFTWNRPRTLEIGINLLALAMFIWLSRLRRGGKR